MQQWHNVSGCIGSARTQSCVRPLASWPKLQGVCCPGCVCRLHSNGVVGMDSRNVGHARWATLSWLDLLELMGGLLVVVLGYIIEGYLHHFPAHKAAIVCGFDCCIFRYRG